MTCRRIKKSFHNCYSRTKNRVTSENLRVFGERIVLRSSRLSRRGHRASKHSADSRSSCRVANFFFGTFFFLAKKKVECFSFTKDKFFKRIFCKNPLPNKNLPLYFEKNQCRSPTFFELTAFLRKCVEDL